MGSIISLKLLVFSPLLISIVFLLPIFSGHTVLIRRFAKIFAGLHFLYALLFYVFANFTTENDNYLSLINSIAGNVENGQLPLNFFSELTFFGSSWINSLGIKLTFGLDGISIFFVILTSFLVLMTCIASKGIIQQKHSLFYALIFILETAILGVFASCDMFEFFMFWELELIPMYFLISLWGDGKAKKSAMKFLLYTFIGSLFMLVGFLMLYNFNFIATGMFSADIHTLTLNIDTTPVYLQILASLFMLFGFAVKLPIIPFHTWLPNAHVDAPTPVSMLLAGILLKMGGYGIIRFNLQLLPDAFLYIAPYLVVLAFINIIFAAIVAYYQNDIKAIVAYSSISTMGIVLLGICSLNTLGIAGAIFLMLAHGIISATLFFIVGTIYKRTKTRELVQLGGLAKVMPRLAGFSLLFMFAGIGVPATMGFVGEFLSFVGAFGSSILNNYMIQTIVIISILVLILSAAYLLKLIHKVFYGSQLERWNSLSDITNHEFVILFVMTFVVILFGVYPMPIIDTISPCILSIVEAFGG